MLVDFLNSLFTLKDSLLTRPMVLLAELINQHFGVFLKFSSWSFNVMKDCLIGNDLAQSGYQALWRFSLLLYYCYLQFY